IPRTPTHKTGPTLINVSALSEARFEEEEFWAEHHISVCASLAALNVNHHALAVDVADFQVRQLGVPHSSGVERQQQNAMVGDPRSTIDSIRDQKILPVGILEGHLDDAETKSPLPRHSKSLLSLTLVILSKTFFRHSLVAQ